MVLCAIQRQNFRVVFHLEPKLWCCVPPRAKTVVLCSTQSQNCGVVCVPPRAKTVVLHVFHPEPKLWCCMCSTQSQNCGVVCVPPRVKTVALCSTQNQNIQSPNCRVFCHSKPKLWCCIPLKAQTVVLCSTQSQNCGAVFHSKPKL